MSVKRIGGEGSFSPMFNQVKGLAKAITSNPEIDTAAFRALGVHPSDTKAQEVMKEKLIEVLKPDARFDPLDSNPGVYFIYTKTQKVADAVFKQDKPIALFKVGNKRANIELAAREIANALGLVEYVPPGVFFGFQNLPIHREWSEEFTEELWNGHTKIYSDSGSVNHAHFGILEPYIEAETSLESVEDQFAMLLFTALAIGLRDGKKDNITSMIIDTEECMPNRLDPKLTQESLDILKQSPCTHLPFLFEHKHLLDRPISDSCIKKMIDRVNQWDLDQIVSEIADKKILFMDKISESRSKGCDAGNCPFEVEASDSTDIENGLYPTIKSGSSLQPIFDEKQIDTFRLRLDRLATFIKENPTFTPRNLIEGLDPFYMFAIDQSTNARFSEEERFKAAGRVSVASMSTAYSDAMQSELEELRKKVRELEVQLARLQSTASPRKRTVSLSDPALSMASPVVISSDKKSPPRQKPIAVKPPSSSSAGYDFTPIRAPDLKGHSGVFTRIASRFFEQRNLGLNESPWHTEDDLSDSDANLRKPVERKPLASNVIRTSRVFEKRSKQESSSSSSNSDSE